MYQIIYPQEQCAEAYSSSLTRALVPNLYQHTWWVTSQHKWTLKPIFVSPSSSPELKKSSQTAGSVSFLFSTFQSGGGLSWEFHESFQEDKVVPRGKRHSTEKIELFTHFSASSKICLVNIWVPYLERRKRKWGGNTRLLLMGESLNMAHGPPCQTRWAT